MSICNVNFAFHLTAYLPLFKYLHRNTPNGKLRQPVGSATGDGAGKGKVPPASHTKAKTSQPERTCFDALFCTKTAPLIEDRTDPLLEEHKEYLEERDAILQVEEHIDLPMLGTNILIDIELYRII